MGGEERGGEGMERVSSFGVVSYISGLLTFHCLFIVLYAEGGGGREIRGETNWRIWMWKEG